MNGTGVPSVRDRCVWCNGSEGPLRKIREVVPDRWGGNPEEREFPVHPRHESEARSFLRRVREGAGFFMKVMLGSVVAGPVLAAVVIAAGAGGGSEETWAAVLVGPYVVALGLFIVRHPFATPETVEWLGLRRARSLARWTGWLTAAVGAWIVALAA